MRRPCAGRAFPDRRQPTPLGWVSRDTVEYRLTQQLVAVSSLTTKAQRNTNSYVRRHLGSFWFHLGPMDPRLKQVSRLFPDRVKPLLQIYWMVEATVKWGPDSTCLLCSTFPGSAQDNTGWIKRAWEVTAPGEVPLAHKKLSAHHLITRFNMVKPNAARGGKKPESESKQVHDGGLASDLASGNTTHYDSNGSKTERSLADMQKLLGGMEERISTL
ncbi:hypothetical protein EYF80_027138 [Liparis tanakae]|uniref:Uncharacterized protein n=1 Tax=Liparis tanakae TaxID=230148 RepID=A0A4Z2HAS3_9TELE|nr:hypothetical protein EYF80_027138 [Liparis tanakae]